LNAFSFVGGPIIALAERPGRKWGALADLAPLPTFRRHQHRIDGLPPRETVAKRELEQGNWRHRTDQLADVLACEDRAALGEQFNGPPRHRQDQFSCSDRALACFRELHLDQIRIVYLENVDCFADSELHFDQTRTVYLKFIEAVPHLNPAAGFLETAGNFLRQAGVPAWDVEILHILAEVGEIPRKSVGGIPGMENAVISGD